jgi:tRNA-dihydrouridine synthase B
MKFAWKNISKPVFILGPMSEISTLPLMKICKEFKADIVFTPMVSSNAVLFDNQKSFKIIEFTKKERPVIVQVFGYDADIVIKSIKIIDKKLKPDGFDINLGCPAPKIVKNMCGSAFLKDHQKAFEFVKKIRENYSGELSIKTRLGLKEFDVLPLLKKFEEIGVNAVTIHGRTVEQKYMGKADWSKIHTIAKSLNIPVILNGDITNYIDAYNELEKSKIAGIMISRMALQKPWIFKELKLKKEISFSKKEICSLLSKHMKYFLDYNRGKAYIEMRKFLASYIKGFKNATELRKTAVSVNNQTDFKNLIKKIKQNNV